MLFRSANHGPELLAMLNMESEPELYVELSNQIIILKGDFTITHNILTKLSSFHISVEKMKAKLQV